MAPAVPCDAVLSQLPSLTPHPGPLPGSRLEVDPSDLLGLEVLFGTELGSPAGMQGLGWGHCWILCSQVEHCEVF